MSLKLGNKYMKKVNLGRLNLFPKKEKIIKAK